MMGNNDSFIYDVTSAYLNGLHVTDRFSALFRADLSIMFFIYLHITIYLLLIKRLIQNLLFYSVTSAIIMYLFLVVMYVLFWANTNMFESGEYLTGFGRHMMTLGVYDEVLLDLYYSFLGAKKDRE